MIFYLNRTILATIVMSLALSVPTSGGTANWPQFRGAGGNPVAANQRVPDRFGPDENVLWKTRVPVGHSSPAVWGDRIFLTGSKGETLQVLCYDRSDGTLRWSRDFSMRGQEVMQHRDSSPAAPTTCVDSKRVYAYFGAYGLVALDHQGDIEWEKEFPVEDNMFGTGTSPILYGGSLYLVRDVAGLSAIHCLDPATGKVRWVRPRPDAGPNFSTPYIWARDGRGELVVAGSGTLRGYDAKTGDELWVVKGLASWITPSPVAAGDILVFGAFTAMNIPGRDRMSTGFDEEAGIPDNVLREPARFIAYFDKDGDGKIQEAELPESRVKDAFTWGDMNHDGGWELKEIEPFMVSDAAPGRNVLVAVRGGGSGDITKSHVLWEKTKGLPYVASPLIYRNRVYFVKEGGFFSCVDLKSGEDVYDMQRLGVGGEYYATPVAVGDRILVGAERGTMFVISATGEFEVVARNDLGEGIYATPAVVDDTLYVRTSEHLWAFKQHAK